MINRLKHSFSARLSFFILAVSTAIFMTAFGVFYYFSSELLEKNARIKAENTLDIINLKIEKVLRRVDVVPDNLKWIVSEGKMTHPDQAYDITRRVLETNPYIYGCAIAFEPDYFKEKGRYFSPYSYRDGDSIRSLQLGTKEYDYFAWDWYKIPKELGYSTWSDPYYDEGGGEGIMCTYSSPMYDPQGRFIGIFTADIGLDWLSDLINKMKRSDQSYTFMLAKDGTYIVHYLKERILNQTIFSVGQGMDSNSQVRRIGEEMTAGKRGMLTFDNDGMKSDAFFAPVPYTHWSLGIVIPHAEVYEDLHDINTTLTVVIVLGLLALFVACLNIVGRLSKPLVKFASSARAIAKGDFQAQLPAIHSNDEMKELSDSFGYMQSELTNYIADLQDTTSAKEKIESELRIAREIQMGMIPKIFPPFPSRMELDLYAVLKPAKEVGGDLYDFFLDGDNLYFAIGDVSGKGVPASLFMAVTRSLFRSVATHIQSPASIVSSLNASISESNDSNMFVTMFVAILDLRNGTLRYCNAGHNPPVMISPQGVCSFMEVIPNIPVGVMEGFSYREQQTTLSDGSSLVLYTDGVTEAENSGKELYGEDRLMNLLTRNAGGSSRKIVETIVDDIDLHVKDNTPSDDITLLVVRYDKEHEVRNAAKEILVIENRIEELDRVAVFIEQIGEKMSLAPALVMNLNLVLEEAVSNTILYGYKGQENKESKKIEVSAGREGDLLVLSITDSGLEFNPTLKNDPDLNLSAEERPIGGLGIYLIKNIMNEVEYQRINGTNIFTMKKKITQNNQ